MLMKDRIVRVEMMNPQLKLTKVRVSGWEYFGEYSRTYTTLEKLRKSWTSPIYGFFTPDPIFHEVNGCRCVEFVCGANFCKKKGANQRWVRRFLDTTDRASTSNLRRHARKCWGKEIVECSLQSDVATMRNGLGNQKDGSLPAAFKAKGKSVVTYSTRLLTKTDVR